MVLDKLRSFCVLRLVEYAFHVFVVLQFCIFYDACSNQNLCECETLESDLKLFFTLITVLAVTFFNAYFQHKFCVLQLKTQQSII